MPLKITNIFGDFVIKKFSSSVSLHFVFDFFPKSLNIFLQQTKNDLTLIHDSKEKVDSSFPTPVAFENDWSCFRVEGPLAFNLIGILGGITHTLISSEISAFIVSTYDTDYFLVKNINREKAVNALRNADYEIVVENENKRTKSPETPNNDNKFASHIQDLKISNVKGGFTVLKFDPALFIQPFISKYFANVEMMFLAKTKDEISLVCHTADISFLNRTSSPSSSVSGSSPAPLPAAQEDGWSCFSVISTTCSFTSTSTTSSTSSSSSSPISSYSSSDTSNHTPFDLVVPGVFAGISHVLAAHRISIFGLSTYMTECFMVKSVDQALAAKVLADAGYEVFADL